MMTIASIDTQVEPVSMDAATQSPATGVSAEAVGAFQQALAGSSGEDAQLGKLLRETIASALNPGKVEVVVRSDGTPIPLPEQVKANVELGATLTAAAAAVGEAQARIDVAAMGGTQVVAPASGADGATAVLPGQAQSLPVTPLPEQVAQNLVLGDELEVALTLGQTASSRLGEVGGSVRSGETPLSPVAEASISKVAETPLSPVSEAPLSPVAETPISKVAETESLQGAAHPGAPADADEPEVNAEALVAAGVIPQAVVQSAAVDAPQAAAVVAPVDVVRVQAAAAAPTEVLVQAAQAVADTLLVSPGLLRGQGEVLVQLRPDVLDGTEVKIAVTGRQLEVVFQPQTVDVAVMIENCRTQLVQHLSAKIVSFNISVDVRKKRETA